MNYQIITYYYNYFPGDDYENAMVMTLIEMTAYTIAGLSYDFLGPKKLLIPCFLISVVGSIGNLIIDRETDLVLNMIFSFIAKAGISGAFNGIYYANDLFPLIFSSTTFGVCFLFGVISGTFSENVLALPNNITFGLFTVLSILGIVFSALLKRD